MRGDLPPWCIIYGVLEAPNNKRGLNKQPQNTQGGQVMNKCSIEISLGMDVSDKSIELFSLSKDSDTGKRGQIVNSRESLMAFCDSIADPSKVLVAMEAGAHSAWHTELLEQRGFHVVVGNARKLAAIWTNKNKSDREDAEMLARLARSDINLLAPIRHMPTSLRVDLAVVKTRNTVSECRTKLISTVRGMLTSFGISAKGITADNFTTEVSKIVPKELRPAMNGILKEIRSMQLSLKAYDRIVTKLNKKYPDTAKVSQITGVGELTALAFVLMVGNPNRFGNGSRVARFFGITPKRDQSGEVDKQLGITKEGNGLMRRLLVQCANYVMSRGPDCELRRFGERIAARGGKIAKRKAKVAVARKITKLMFSLWLTGEVYDPEYKKHSREARKIKKSEDITTIEQPGLAMA